MSGPWRRDFDAARDPYAARNALGIQTTPAGAPTSAEYITASADATLTNERVLTNTPTIAWDFSTPGQAKASAAGGGNVSNSGTPTAGQIAQWTDATHIQGVSASSVLDARSMFHAMLPADQIGFPTAIDSKVNFSTAVNNVGGNYNAPIARWTPPAGRVMLTSNIWCAPAVVNILVVTIYKNGAGWRTAPMLPAGVDAQCTITVLDVANGTDYYEIWMTFNGGSGTVFSSSFFAGALL